jgi:hypothetical protein
MITQEQIQNFTEACKAINHAYMDKQFPSNRKDAFSFKIGKRYAKIVRTGSVHCFVDMSNGDVLKAASWNTPAKGARGNINDEHKGLGRMNEYGTEYNNSRGG